VLGELAFGYLANSIALIADAAEDHPTNLSSAARAILQQR
jgi:Co/Zn/Cd efflux system component